MNLTLKQIVKYFFFFFLFLTIYFAIVCLMLPYFTDPQIHQFDDYHRLENWDLAMHGRQDFDGDGQEDLISFTGCAFLSSVEPDQIPEGEQCTAPGVVNLTFRDQPDRIGQKYIQTKTSNLGFDTRLDNFPITHSYMGKAKDQNWTIYVNANQGLQTYQIGADGLLRQTNDVKISNRLDEVLYSLSRFFVILVWPLIPLFFIFTPLFETNASSSFMLPVNSFLFLTIITLILYLLWKKLPQTNVSE